MHKIYWFGFKRQLIEFYHLLLSQNLIDCDIDEFFPHFTGKKLAIEEDYSSKIKWLGNADSMQLIIGHLTSKRFLQGEDTQLKTFKSHFRLSADSINSNHKRLQKKLDFLYPETSGYRCKERLFYKARNKTPMSKLLNELSIHWRLPPSCHPPDVLTGGSRPHTFHVGTITIRTEIFGRGWVRFRVTRSQTPVWERSHFAIKVGYSPMILTSTLFLLFPSNSP